MFEKFFEWRRFLDTADAPVDSRSRESLPHEIGEQVTVFSLRITNERRKDHHLLATPGGQDALHDLVARLRLENSIALRAVGRADPCIQHTQKVMDLRHRGDGRARIGPSRFLRDRDRR